MKMIKYYLIKIYIVFFKFLIEFCNDNFFSDHHIVSSITPRDEISRVDLRKYIKDILYRRAPCVLLVYDLNIELKKLLGLNDIDDVYVRDVGKYYSFFIDFHYLFVMIKIIKQKRLLIW